MRVNYWEVKLFRFHCLFPLAISLNFSPKRARNLVSLSESFTEVLARRETAKSFFAASAAEADVLQTAIV